MNIKVSMVIMSHLSDIQEDISNVRNRVDFIKFMVMKYKNTETEIDADVEYDLFISKFPEKKFV